MFGRSFAYPRARSRSSPRRSGVHASRGHEMVDEPLAALRGQIVVAHAAAGCRRVNDAIAADVDRDVVDAAVVLEHQRGRPGRSSASRCGCAGRRAPGRATFAAAARRAGRTRIARTPRRRSPIDGDVPPRRYGVPTNWLAVESSRERCRSPLTIGLSESGSVIRRRRSERSTSELAADVRHGTTTPTRNSLRRRRRVRGVRHHEAAHAPAPFAEEAERARRAASDDAAAVAPSLSIDAPRSAVDGGRADAGKDVRHELDVLAERVRIEIGEGVDVGAPRTGRRSTRGGCRRSSWLSRWSCPSSSAMGGPESRCGYSLAERVGRRRW